MYRGDFFGGSERDLTDQRCNLSLTKPVLFQSLIHQKSRRSTIVLMNLLYLHMFNCKLDLISSYEQFYNVRVQFTILHYRHTLFEKSFLLLGSVKMFRNISLACL